MKESRRAFMLSVVAGGSLNLLPSSANALIQPVLNRVERHSFPLPEYSSYVGDSVKIYVQDHWVKAFIKSVEAGRPENKLHPRPNHLRKHSLIVRFDGVDTAKFANDVYTVKHSRIGQTDLLLSVVPNEQGELALEAIFN